METCSELKLDRIILIIFLRLCALLQLEPLCGDWFSIVVNAYNSVVNTRASLESDPVTLIMWWIMVHY